MKDLPYFLSLIKKNFLLWTIISTSSFSSLHIKNTPEHYFRAKHFLFWKNYQLNKDEKFDEVWIKVGEFSSEISFYTSSSKYLENTECYFGKDTLAENQGQYVLNGIKSESISKDLGFLKIAQDTAAHVILRKSNIYGNKITLTFYKKNWKKMVDKELDSSKRIDSVKK